MLFIFLWSYVFNFYVKFESGSGVDFMLGVNYVKKIKGNISWFVDSVIKYI